jgi:hypothetical protein
MRTPKCKHTEHMGGQRAWAWLGDLPRGRGATQVLPREGVYSHRHAAHQFPKLFQDVVVLQERIELSTSPLPRECSTTELLQHLKARRAYEASGFLP